MALTSFFSIHSCLSHSFSFVTSNLVCLIHSHLSHSSLECQMIFCVHFLLTLFPFLNLLFFLFRTSFYIYTSFFPSPFHSPHHYISFVSLFTPTTVPFSFAYTLQAFFTPCLHFQHLSISYSQSPPSLLKTLIPPHPHENTAPIAIAFQPSPSRMFRLFFFLSFTLFCPSFLIHLHFSLCWLLLFGFVFYICL